MSKQIDDVIRQMQEEAESLEGDYQKVIALVNQVSKLLTIALEKQKAQADSRPDILSALEGLSLLKQVMNIK